MNDFDGIKIGIDGPDMDYGLSLISFYHGRRNPSFYPLFEYASVRLAVFLWGTNTRYSSF